VSVLQLAVVGAGHIGQRHMDLIGQSSRARLCAVVDPCAQAAALAARRGVPHLTSLQALLSGARPDGVVLATPNHLHAGGALLCAAHGVPALIEKPLAASFEEGRTLVQALAAPQLATVPMLVGHHRRHSALLAEAQAVISSGELGRLVTLSGSAQFVKPDSYFEAGPWRKQAGGGPLLINLVHEIDNMRALCGDIVSVQALSSNAIREFPVEDTVVLNFQFANGVLGTFALSDVAAGPRSWEQTSGEDPVYPFHAHEDCYFLCGTRGSLAVPTLRTWRYRGERSWWEPFEYRVRLRLMNDPLAAQLAHFCDVIQGVSLPCVTPADALENLRVIQAARIAISTQRLVRLDEVLATDGGAV